MWPELISGNLPFAGEFSLASHSALIFIGSALAIFLCTTCAPTKRLSSKDILDVSMLSLLFGLAGARLAAVLFDGHLHDYINLCLHPEWVDAPGTAVTLCRTDSDCGQNFCHLPAYQDVLDGKRRTMCTPPKDCWALFKIFSGGLTFYGGLILGGAAALMFSIQKKLPIKRTLDLLAPFMMLGLAFGRLGCFLGGCCYGAQTSMPWAVKFPGLVGMRHPTQLYECFFVLMLSILFWPKKSTRADGKSAGWLLLSYGIYRLFIEVLRADARGALGALSTSQWISIPLIAIGVLLVKSSKKQVP